MHYDFFLEAVSDFCRFCVQHFYCRIYSKFPINCVRIFPFFGLHQFHEPGTSSYSDDIGPTSSKQWDTVTRDYCCILVVNVIPMTFQNRVCFAKLNVHVCARFWLWWKTGEKTVFLSNWCSAPIHTTTHTEAKHSIHSTRMVDAIASEPKNGS